MARLLNRMRAMKKKSTGTRATSGSPGASKHKGDGGDNQEEPPEPTCSAIADIQVTGKAEEGPCQHRLPWLEIGGKEVGVEKCPMSPIRIERPRIEGFQAPPEAFRWARIMMTRIRTSRNDLSALSRPVERRIAYMANV